MTNQFYDWATVRLGEAFRHKMNKSFVTTEGTYRTMIFLRNHPTDPSRAIFAPLSESPLSGSGPVEATKADLERSAHLDVAILFPAEKTKFSRPLTQRLIDHLKVIHDGRFDSVSGPAGTLTAADMQELARAALEEAADAAGNFADNPYRKAA